MLRGEQRLKEEISQERESGGGEGLGFGLGAEAASGQLNPSRIQRTLWYGDKHR